MRPILGTTAGRLVVVACTALAVATCVGMVVLWPGESSVSEAAPSEPTYRAEVQSVEAVPCPAPDQEGCASARARLLDGPDAGRTTALALISLGQSDLVDPGDRVTLTRSELPPDAPNTLSPYNLVSFERGTPLLLLLLGFVVIVIAFARWRGILALLGLGLSLGVVAVFMVPAILDGKAPVAVAVVGALGVMFITISLAHGLGPQSLAAMLGTATSLALIIGLASLFAGAANLSGLASDESTLLLAGQDGLSLRGLVLAGFIVGALGVLDDVTVSQASTVMALRRANAALGPARLYREALVVGRDHVAATVNTLVLAYLGASLPLVLLFSVGDTSLGEAIDTEAVAQEIVGTLVGSIGLVAAVPVTTALAAVLAVRFPDHVLPAAGAHAH